MMRMPPPLVALLAVGWPTLCRAEPLKVFDDPKVQLVLFGFPALLLFGLPALLLLGRYGGRRQAPPIFESVPDLTAERCALLREACRARGLHLQSLATGPLGLMLTVAAGTQAYELKAAVPHGLRGDALQDALVQSALGRLDALLALRGIGASRGGDG